MPHLVKDNESDDDNGLQVCNLFYFHVIDQWLNLINKCMPDVLFVHMGYFK